jgi:hypothetical protein
MSELPPDEPSIAAAGADAGGRKAAAHEARCAPETDQLGRVNRENGLASGTVEGQRGRHRSRAKGDRIEREIVSRHAAIRIKAKRYPLSGGSRFRGGHDVDIDAFGTDEGPLVAEGKSRCPDGSGLLRWHGEVVTASRTRHDPDHSRVVA